MDSDDKTPEWFDYPPTDFIAFLTNALREQVSKAHSASEIIGSEKTLEAILPDGKQVDLLGILVNSLERAQDLLDLAVKYVEVHPQTGKIEDKSAKLPHTDSG